MKTAFCISALLVISFAVHAPANDKHKDNKSSSKAAQSSAKSSSAKSSSGAPSSSTTQSAAARATSGGAQHSVRRSNVDETRQASHAEHGLNTEQGEQHGPNSHDAEHGLNAHQSGQPGVSSHENGEHGLNAHQNGQHGVTAHQTTQHGVTAHQTAQHGANARASATLQAEHGGKLSGNAPVRKGFAREGDVAGHWRSGVHWRDYHAVYASYHRTWHDRGWWRSHYNRVVFVGGGNWSSYWYWDGGYWFPAWGYDPAYVSYAYDAPIYAYDNLPPDQVVINIQEALQDQGYYTGQIDGQLGEQTRDAIAAYQRDHNLELTAAIDEATVQSLGLSSSEQT